jgi:tripeptide aminopeptidase
LLNAVLEILRQKLPHPPLTFCWFVQEEIGLQGSRNMRKSLFGNPKLAFNWDGGPANKLTVGATGGYRMDIEVTGIASHAGVAPERGVSAIGIAALAIADLQRSGWHGDVRKGRKQGTSNIGVIAGGDATNVVTDRVTIKAEARSHDPAFRARIIREIERSFQRASKEIRNVFDKRGSARMTGRLDYEAFQLAEHEPCVVAADQAVRAIGVEPFRAVTNGGLDANWISSHGIPAVTLGCGQVNPHMTTEELDIPQFEAACRIGLLLATGMEA